jgi:hypothetical protein
MRDLFEVRVRAAGRAAWCVFITGYCLNLAQYLFYLVAMSARPSWLLSLFGPNIDWPQAQTVWLWGTVAFKFVNGCILLTALWLTLWAKQLRNSPSTGV